MKDENLTSNLSSRERTGDDKLVLSPDTSSL